MSDIDHTYWYLNRASGFVAYLLLFGSVALGLTMTGGVIERALRRYRVYDLHRFVSLLTLGVCVFHALIVLPDGFVRFSLAQLLVPTTSPYRPMFVAFGIFALYLAAVIVGAFYARRAISYRAWRMLHYATFAAFVLALAHGAGAGTDTGAPWASYLYALTGLIAFNMLVFRLMKGSARPGPAAISRRRPHAGRGCGHTHCIDAQRAPWHSAIDDIPEASKAGSESTVLSSQLLGGHRRPQR